MPGFGYDDLDVGDGRAASSALAALILDGEPKAETERAALRRTLLAYCARDTLGTVGVLARLRNLARDQMAALRTTTEDLYFAYGSNLNAAQMGERCPGAQVVGRMTLPDHALAFVGRGKHRGGGGVATVVARTGSKVEGLVHALTAGDWARLDKIEGNGRSYDRRPLTVIDGSGDRHTAWVYIHCSSEPRAPALPYLDLILAAYTALGFEAAPLHRAAAGSGPASDPAR